MAVYTTIDDPSAYFQTAIYTGNGGTLNVVNDGNSDLQPDWLWFKSRSHTTDHGLQDTVRGNDKAIQSNSNLAEADVGSSQITALNTDGFSLSSGGDVNTNTRTYVCWQWKAGGGSGSSNTDGTINTSSTSVSTTAGFSISKYTGTGSNATFGHGLGVTPKVIWWKRLDNDNGGVNWIIQSPILGAQTKMVLNTTEATSTGSSFSATGSWTNSVVDLKTYEGQNSSSAVYVAYCFAEKQGYSKFGSYTGNGNVNGTFVYTGFKPAWIVIKQTNATRDWMIYDSKRDPFNVMRKQMEANSTSAEDAYDNIDFLSNGFKLRTTSAGRNGNGLPFFFMAFAESPFVNSNGVPGTAR